MIMELAAMLDHLLPRLDPRRRLALNDEPADSKSGGQT